MNYHGIYEEEFKYILSRAKKFMNYSLFYAGFNYFTTVILFWFYTRYIFSNPTYFNFQIKLDSNRVELGQYINRVLPIAGVVTFIHHLLFAMWIYYCNSTKVYYFNTDARNFVCKYNGTALWWCAFGIQMIIIPFFFQIMWFIPLSLTFDLIYRFIYNSNAKQDYMCSKGIKMVDQGNTVRVYIYENDVETEISTFRG